MVPPVGFEPTIYGLKVRCPDQAGLRGRPERRGPTAQETVKVVVADWVAPTEPLWLSMTSPPTRMSRE